MKHVIVGTAGHIDHGKTALVKALTGIDADRLAEEKRRGITIDLGFAHLDLPPGLRLGFVDVPGHERFIKNMLAGAGGIDILLLVISAAESIKPQTREHFDICRLLGIRTGLVALTKADLVDQDILELARLEVEEFVMGSFLQGAPIIPVSAITGQGLDELRLALARTAAQIPARNPAGHFRLPIDRAFSMKGFGAVVTGTLISGTVHLDQEVTLYPEGRRLRVRGIQVHGAAASQAVPGQRTAINLAGIEAREIARGMTLAAPGFRPVRKLDCAIEILPGAPPLKNRAPVHFHAGTAEIEAEIGFVPQTGRTHARIVLREPALLLPGDRFIIRRFSPVTTLGGGVILDIGGKRLTEERLSTIQQATPADWVRFVVRESGAGMTVQELVARTGFTAAEILAVKGPLHLGGWLVDRDWVEATRHAMIARLREFHRTHPLLPGMPKQDFRGNLPAPLLDAILVHPEIAVEGELVRHRTHRVVLQQQEEQARTAIEAAFEHAGLAVPSVAEVLAQSGVEPGPARTLLQILLREGKLLRVTAELVFHRSAIEQLRRDLASIHGARLSVGDFKERTGISRKYAIPLLEYLDSQKVTRREGDTRVVL